MFVKDDRSILNIHYYGAISPWTNTTGRYYIFTFSLTLSRDSDVVTDSETNYLRVADHPSVTGGTGGEPLLSAGPLS